MKCLQSNVCLRRTAHLRSAKYKLDRAGASILKLQLCKHPQTHFLCSRWAEQDIHKKLQIILQNNCCWNYCDFLKKKSCYLNNSAAFSFYLTHEYCFKDKLNKETNLPTVAIKTRWLRLLGVMMPKLDNSYLGGSNALDSPPPFPF